jgi:hypothetical protein
MPPYVLVSKPKHDNSGHRASPARLLSCRVVPMLCQNGRGSCPPMYSDPSVHLCQKKSTLCMRSETKTKIDAYGSLVRRISRSIVSVYALITVYSFPDYMPAG